MANMMTSVAVHIFYIFVCGWNQASTTQAQRFPDETAYRPVNLTSFLEQLLNMTYKQNNRNEYYQYSSPVTNEPAYLTFDPNNWNWDELDKTNKSNLITSTMIAVAIALIVLIKLTLIALMVRRGRRLQQRMTVISSNHTSIPNEFENDSAHLVTPATIMYVEPQDLYSNTGVPSIPCSSGTPGMLLTPPPYSEASTGTSPLLQVQKDNYPPPAYQESQDS